MTTTPGFQREVKKVVKNDPPVQEFKKYFDCFIIRYFHDLF